MVPLITDASVGAPAVKYAVGSYSVNATLTNPRGAPVTDVCTSVIALAIRARAPESSNPDGTKH
jgi:hypothetical protein